MPNPFAISTTHQNNIAIITLDGFVDAHTAPQFEAAIQTELDANNVRIVVDCSKLNYISSAGLGVFMSFIEEVRDLNGDIKISGLVPKVRHTFEILGFHDLFEMSEDLNSALASFSAAQSAKEG